MSEDDIREMVRTGKISPESGAKMLEHYYVFRRIGRRARLRRWLFAPLRWVGLWR